ncbi:MAG: globin [Candidatus Obscuribacterales bacterium]|jgi:hemoglobin|nr:globin [Candidatus Obscuribacterales bacterium]
MQQDPVSMIYSAVGSEEPFFRLVDRFYEGVAEDPLLRPLYPEDLTKPKEHLALFLIQRFGGRGTYSQERGHPRMRMRHMPFKIGIKERDAWLNNMDRALAAVPEFAAHRDTLDFYFRDFATFLMNAE